MIPTRVHGVLDYVMGLLLIASPWLFDFLGNDTATLIPVMLGAGALIYSAFTDYELGVVKRLPMRVHLGLDAASGLLLAAAPWLFGFADYVWVPHVVLGLVEVVAAATTSRTPSYRTASTDR